MNKRLLLKTFVRAFAVLVYVIAITFLTSQGEMIFQNTPDFIVAPFMLLLFVFSATLTGFLVLGEPIRLYMDEARKEAVVFLFTLLGWLFLFLIIILGIVASL